MAGVFDDERAHRQAQHDYERAREERDREFFEARQRQRRIWQEQDRIWQEKLEQSLREDAEQRAADAKADALALRQMWQQLLKAASKPVQVVPLAPDRELDQVDNQSESSKASKTTSETSKRTSESSVFASEFSSSRPKSDPEAVQDVRIVLHWPKSLFWLQFEFSNSRHPEDRPRHPNSQIPDPNLLQRQTVQGVRILKFQTFARSRGRPSKTAFTSVPSATPFHCVDNLVPDRELAQVHRQSSKNKSA